MAKERSWFVGAYALTATLSAFSDKDAQSFYEELKTLPHLAGLELPLHKLDRIDDPWRHLRLLPRELDYIITPLPFVMQSLETQPAFGLASPDAAGRATALQAVELIRERIKRLEDHCGRAAVRAVELHSAPTRDADARSLRQSLEVIVQKDWGSAELWLEHCDAFIPGQTPAKGFLDIDAEIALLQEFGLGLNINWGRSLLETRSVFRVLKQLSQARKSGVLRSLFFSGVAVQDPIYGTWLDNHVPMQWDHAAPWMPQSSWLTLDAARTALAAADAVPFLGLKIQPAPTSLALHERLDCVGQHLEQLHSLAKSSPAHV